MPARPSARLDRRAFLRMAGAAWAASLAARPAFALARTDAVFASGYREPDGSFGIAVLTEDGTIIERTPLPARSHGMAFSPVTNHLVAFARRPGTFALVIDRTGATAPVTIAAAPRTCMTASSSYKVRAPRQRKNRFANPLAER